MRPSDVELVLIRAAAHGDITAEGGDFWWRDEPVTPSMRAHLDLLTTDRRDYLRICEVTTPTGRHLVVPSGGGRAVLR